MSKGTQGFILYNLMKAAGDKGVTKAEIAKALGVREGSIGIYLFGLRKFCNAEFETVKQGRKVVSYKLINADKINVPSARRGSKTVTKPAKVAKVTKTAAVKPAKVEQDHIAPDADLHVSQFSDREFNDIKSSLGLV